MKLMLTLSPDHTPALPNDLYEELSQLTLPVEPPQVLPVSNPAIKGDPITVTTIVAIALGIG